MRGHHRICEPCVEEFFGSNPTIDLEELCSPDPLPPPVLNWCHFCGEPTLSRSKIYRRRYIKGGWDCSHLHGEEPDAPRPETVRDMGSGEAACT
jgi:hypothetical protein